MKVNFRKIFIFIVFFSLQILKTELVFASETQGTIDSTYKYAWSNQAGWINFNPSNGNIKITDNGITGYAWSENYGWINMAPSQSGVKINSNGTLSGYAWGENLGWINFSGVSINCNGQFKGTASGDIIGILTFDCSNCKVVTDYRPPNCRTTPPQPPFCGDGSCNGTETCLSCPQDCGECPPFCGDGKCNGNETCSTCPADCGECPPFCGDNKCQPPETCNTCPQDCGECKKPFCGDGECSGNETCSNCPVDCGECPIICGDKICQITETCLSCPQDCGECPPFCGDGKCNGNETCSTCPADCGECIIPPKPVCGNKICEKGEGCLTCPDDCGECPPLPPQIDIPLRVITTTALVVTVLTTAFASPFTLPELFLLPTRLLGAILIAFGWKKRNPPWGVVYDSVTKQPLDPAYITLKTADGNTISSCITDIDGRYGFLAEPGFYKMTAQKTNYLFPSQKLAGKSQDELYDNLYFGEEFEIKRDTVVNKNIPLDPISFDWNEFVKQKKHLTKFFTRWDLFLRKISDLLYAIGFILAIIAFLFAPYPYNTIILCLYIFLFALRILGVKPRPFGSVIDKKTGLPLPFAIIRIIDASSHRQISHRITDRYGRYFCLVPKGKYYVKIEKKKDDGSYALIYISSVIDATKTGIIKNIFKIPTEEISLPQSSLQ